jgi:hypothetical protein
MTLFLPLPLHSEEQATTIIVEDFVPSRDPSASIVSEMIRVGLAQSPFFRLIDANVGASMQLSLLKVLLRPEVREFGQFSGNRADNRPHYPFTFPSCRKNPG